MEKEGQATAADLLTQPRAAVRTRYEAAERGRSDAWRHPPKGGGRDGILRRTAARAHTPHAHAVSALRAPPTAARRAHARRARKAQPTIHPMSPPSHTELQLTDIYTMASPQRGSSRVWAARSVNNCIVCDV